MQNLFHYTDQSGWNGIRSQPVWRFSASQPQATDRPTGAYFTDLEPSAQNLRVLCKKLRIPNTKRKYVFWFLGNQGLTQLSEGRGRDQRIYFSATDYFVELLRQRFNGLTEEVSGEFP